MKPNVSDLADFYQQLALIVKSNLPLPDGIVQLGRDVPKLEFQDAIRDIGQRVAQGVRMADAMRQHPGIFSPFHVSLIQIGEESGTLSDTLSALARLARFSHTMRSRFRHILAYPLVTLHMCLLIVLFLGVLITPSVGTVFVDLLEGERLPVITRIVLAIGMGIRHVWMAVLGAYLVLLFLSVWIFLPGSYPRQTLLYGVSLLPGSMRILKSLDAARLSSIWAAFFRQGLPMPDVLAISAGLVEQPETAAALNRAAERAKAGFSVCEALAEEKDLDPFITLTLKHSAQDRLADEFDKLAELYEHRVVLSAKSAFHAWTLLLLILMIVGVGITVFAMIAPLLSVLSAMSG